jgi:hypothetical protein
VGSFQFQNIGDAREILRYARKAALRMTPELGTREIEPVCGGSLDSLSVRCLSSYLFSPHYW